MEYPFELSPFQKDAIRGIEEGKKIIYTAPIKSLSNQKFYDFSKKFPEISFGILTGDIKFNPEADCLIMTTEILRNHLFQRQSLEIKKNVLNFEMDIENELGCVIFDEVHYINDKERGKVWEETIMMLPTHIQMLMLSATIDTPIKFASWIESQHPNKEVWLCSTSHRVVPLRHYMYMTVHESMLDGMKDKKQVSEFRQILDRPQLLKGGETIFDDLNYHKMMNIRRYMDKHHIYIKRSYVLNKLVRYLDSKEMLPGICFVFSRKGVEKCAAEISHSLFDGTSTIPETIDKECKQILLRLPNWREFVYLPEYTFMMKILRKGVAIHHSGVLPVLREMVELLFSKGYIKLLFATETFAVGINMPTKTAIFSSLMKYDGSQNRLLLGHEYTQMAGRAGRRGLDTIGHVIHVNNLFDQPLIADYRIMMKGDPQKLVSKFRIHYHLVLNLIRSKTDNMTSFMNQSMNQETMQRDITTMQEDIAKHREDKTTFLSNYKITIPQDILQEYEKLTTNHQYRSNKDKKRYQRRKHELVTLHSTLPQEMNLYITKLTFDDKELQLQNQLHFLETYNEETIHIFLRLMVENGQVAKEGEEYTVTKKGIDLITVQEWNGIVAADLLETENYFESLSSRELVKLFACFTNIVIPDDNKTYYKNHRFCGTSLSMVLQNMETIMSKYLDIDIQNVLDTGLNFTYHFDLLPYMDEWIEASDENVCTKILKKMEIEKGIFLGEFVKAMLKVNTMALELEKVAEQNQELDFLIKLREIPELILKYVATTQSLYI